jgi:hypothetical protein
VVVSSLAGREAAEERDPMDESRWIEWTRTNLHPREREDLLAALTMEQKAQLLEHDYVWLKGAGVLWKPPDGALRRARFTHGTHFRTKHGEFYIDSEGGAAELSNVRPDTRGHGAAAGETQPLKVA